MTDIAEIVDLPDPAVRPLVHPLDLPPARPLFRRWCLVGTVTSPPVAFCAGGLVWFASQGYVAAVAVGVALVGVGAWAGRCLDDEAWAFIPRRRWDGGRSLPLSGELASAALLAGLLVAVLLLVAGRLAQPGVPSPVRAVVFGMGAAADVAELAGLAYRAVRAPRSAGRAGLLALPWAAAFIGCAVVA
jgi:hypothetical protein